jgi:hypothetical protein
MGLNNLPLPARLLHPFNCLVEVAREPNLAYSQTLPRRFEPEFFSQGLPVPLLSTLNAPPPSLNPSPCSTLPATR